MLTFLNKINIEKYDKKQLGILFVIGVLLVVIAMPTSSSDTEEVVEVIQEVEIISNSDYKTQMEEQLISVLSMVEGVGEVKVMITLQSTTEKIVEKDTYIKDGTMEETTIYQDSNEGEVPYVNQEIYPIVEGVVVAATGGDNSVVVQNITEAIQALFEVDTHKIKIMKMISDD